MIEMKTIVYPDMIEAAFSVDEIDLLNTWIIFKAIDIKKNNGRGFYSRFSAIDILVNLSKLAKSSAYRILSSGDGVYWNIANDRVYIRGTIKICKHLGIKVLNKKGVEISLDSLCQKRGDNRAYLMGIMAASAQTPQSYENIAGRCNICRRTAVTYLGKCDHVRIIPNYTVLSKHSTKEECLDALGDIKEKNQPEANRYQALRDNGGYYIGYRLPNSFVSELETVGTKLKKRINKKIRDGNPGLPTDFRGAPLENRTFIVNNKKTTLGKSDNYYDYKATVKEVIVGENNIREEMRIWASDEFSG